VQERERLPELHNYSNLPFSDIFANNASLLGSNASTHVSAVVAKVVKGNTTPTLDPCPRRYEWSLPAGSAESVSSSDKLALEDSTNKGKGSKSPCSTSTTTSTSFLVTYPTTTQPLFRAPSSSSTSPPALSHPLTPPCRTCNPYQGSPYPTHQAITCLPRTLDSNGCFWPTLILAE
jgi:hypothetical protein